LLHSILLEGEFLKKGEDPDQISKATNEKVTSRKQQKASRFAG
jgi:hypothetical protein